MSSWGVQCGVGKGARMWLIPRTHVPDEGGCVLAVCEDLFAKDLGTHLQDGLLGEETKGGRGGMGPDVTEG